MRWAWCILPALGLTLALAGCQDQDNPPPQLNEGVTVGDGGRTLLPTIVPSLKDRGSIIASAVSAEEVGSAKPAGDAAANVIKIQIDDSTPDGLMKGFVAIIEAGNFAQLPDIVIPEQQEAARLLAGAIGPLFQGLKALDAKWKEKFPDAPLPTADSKMPGLDQMTAPKVTEVKETTPDAEAEATVENAGGGQPEKVQLKKVDGAWRLNDPKMKIEGGPEAAKKFLAIFTELGKGIQEFVTRLDNNEFASADEAKKAFDEAGQKAMAGLMADLAAKMGDAMKDAANAPPAAPETLQPAPPPDDAKAKGKKKPKPNNDDDKPKSELEQGVDNAAGRSALGGI